MKRKPVRRATPAPDATVEPDPGPAPEAVFDRVTGPFVRRTVAPLPGRIDE
ncbi:MAG TPA: hypothetical protein VFP84_06540 [Kofleriaceae bacterium]|nr:hypothetical protein [Kofleriaceae bacterium]